MSIQLRMLKVRRGLAPAVPGDREGRPYEDFILYMTVVAGNARPRRNRFRNR